MSIIDWSKFASEQEPKKLSLMAKRRKRSIQDTQRKGMTMNVWRATIVKPEREAICDRCESAGDWADDRTTKHLLMNSVHVLVMVRGGGMTSENAALICTKCMPMFFAVRNSLKMRAHYFGWLARHQKTLDLRNEQLAKPKEKRVIEEIDDDELERLLGI
jgi:hypothetical protein